MAGWTVTSQASDQVKVNDAGQTIIGVQVYFITGEGNRASVFIPDDHYSAKTVQAAIAAKAKIVDEVGALAHGIE